MRPTSLQAVADGCTIHDGTNFKRNSPVVSASKPPSGGGFRPKGFFDLYCPLSEGAPTLLGNGAYARVEAWRRKSDTKEVAVKIVESFGNERCRQKVFKEIEIYSLCSGHPHIIDLKEYFEEDGLFYLVFPRMYSSLFETVLVRGHLCEIEAANVIRQITLGLAYLHSRGIAHRDIKPENILCARQGHLDPVMICDFDLGSPVKLVRENNTTTPTLLTPVGSAEFMAPEVVNCWLADQATSYDKKCDLWSLGVISYVLLCGYAPFNGNCSSDCGWQDQGKYCQDCQFNLFYKIQSCSIGFPESEWRLVSDLAKEFVLTLLVRDAKVRPSAVDILNHDWLQTASSSRADNGTRDRTTLLATPSTLKISGLSFLMERSNDAFRRASLMADQLDGSLLSFASMPSAKFALGSDDDDDDDDEDTDDDEDDDNDDEDHYLEDENRKSDHNSDVKKVCDVRTEGAVGIEMAGVSTAPNSDLDDLLATTPRAGIGAFERLDQFASNRAPDIQKGSNWTLSEENSLENSYPDFNDSSPSQ